MKLVIFLLLYSLSFSSEVINLKAYTGNPFSYKVEGGKTLKNPPTGMSLNKKTGVITWQPGYYQNGVFNVEIIKNSGEKISLKINSIKKDKNSKGIYVDFDSKINGDGKIETPYNSFKKIKASPGDTIYIRGGHYFKDTIITLKGKKGKYIKVTRLPGERVLINFKKKAFNIKEKASYVIIDGFEIDGMAVEDHYEILKNKWWHKNQFSNPDLDKPNGGETGININGTNIIIQNNVIHDTYQKGINISDGRYITIKGNIVYNIAHTSLTGGHGIMKQWDNDLGKDTDQYRYDIYGNLVFGVEQRIYSWVINKPYSNLVIDEGKAILIDRTNDDKVKARIANNLLLYNGLTNIRLKRIPNLEVYNNNIYTDPNRVSPIPDGITEKENIPNLELYNNLITTHKDGIAIDLSKQKIKDKKNITNNYINSGITKGYVGRIKVDEIQKMNFKYSTFGSDIGIDKESKEHLDKMIKDYGIELKSTNWVHNHLKNVETIVKNVNPLFTNPRIGKSTVDKNKYSLYYDVDKKWAKKFGYEIFQLILPEEFVEVHKADYPTVDPSTLKISKKIQYQGRKK